MRRLLTTLVTLGLLLLAADRVGVLVAERVIAGKLQASEQLAQRPDVHVRGFPFLTQALAGRYDQVDTTAAGVERDGVRVARLQASLRGVRLPLSDALGGNVRDVPLRGLTASAVVSYVDLASRSGLAGVRIEPYGDRVRVVGRLLVLGRQVTVATDSSVRLEGRSIVVTARSASVQGGVSALVSSALGGRLDLRVPVGRLPYDLQLTGLQVTPGGLVLAARSGPTVLTLP